MKNFNYDIILGTILSGAGIDINYAPVVETRYNPDSYSITIPSFDVDMDDFRLLMMAHQAGHLIFTPSKEWELHHRNNTFLEDCMNVIEDVRVDKGMIIEYPGLKRIYNNGYKILEEGGVLSFCENGSKEEVETLQNINNFLKLQKIHFGWDAENFFTKELSNILKKVETMISFKDSFSIAVELFEYLNPNNNEKNANDNSNIESENGVSNDESESKDQEIHSPLNLFGDLAEKLSISTNDNSTDELFGDKKNYINPPIELTIKTLKDCEKYFNNVEKSKHIHNPNFNMSLVNKLFFAFERKKKAKNMEPNFVYDKGKINEKKLYSYRFNESIFLKKDTIKNAKNHSILFLLDMSSSMRNIINDCYHDICEICLFLEKSNIKYEILGFTTFGKKNVKTYDDSLSLYNIIPHETSKQQRKQELYKNVLFDNLRTTPLNQAIYWMHSYIDVFKRKTQTEITSLIVISDGHANDNSQMTNMRIKTQMIEKPFTILDIGEGKRYNSFTVGILNNLKMTYPDLNLIGYFLGKNGPDEKGYDKYFNTKNMDVNDFIENFTNIISDKGQII